MSDDAKRKEIIREAAEHHSSLNVFHAVIALLESGAVYDGNTSAQRIIAICKAECQRQLGRYDKAVERAIQ